MTTWVYVDETKRAGYVLAATTVTDPDAARRAIRGLILPGQRRLHMVDERPSRKRTIVSALVAMQITTTIYDAARRYRTEREARAACLTALVEDLAATGGDTRVVIEQDDSLVGYDNQRLIEAIRATAQRDTLHYEHLHAHEDLALALPDVAAWCWVRSGEWRRRIGPVLGVVRTV
ncbi:MAG: hypothetical protein ACYDH5_10560 [Acidimicrobiales bacterium]